MFSNFARFNSFRPWQYQMPQYQMYSPQMRIPQMYGSQRYQRPAEYYQPSQPRYQNRLAMLRNYDQSRRNQYANAVSQNRLRQDTWNRYRPQQGVGSSGRNYGRTIAREALLPGLSIGKKIFGGLF